jgi:hypothetical protein
VIITSTPVLQITPERTQDLWLFIYFFILFMQRHHGSPLRRQCVVGSERAIFITYIF